ncbi:MAG: TolC family protein [Elusimicrobia bacterium]|nr:TolC family protein [Elusimicrobiota bacterium]
MKPFLVLTFVWLWGTLLPGFLTAEWKGNESGAANVIENISVQPAGKTTKVIIQSSQPLKYRELSQSSPSALFLYMSEPTVSKRPAVDRPDDKVIQEIRMGYKGATPEDGKSVSVDYVLIKLNGPANYTISQRDWILVVEMRGTGARPSRASFRLPGTAPEPILPKRKGHIRASLPPDPVLRDFLDVGLANHVPLRMAEDEYRLSKFRYTEAARSLFPSVTGKYESSLGTLEMSTTTAEDDTDFRRKEVGVQLGQPIFQSGRLYYSLRQAAEQKRISAQNVQKTQADITFEIIKAYHNFAKSQRTMKARRELLDRANKVLELTRKKKQLELITEAEALGVESQYTQIHYRTLSDEKDIEVARIKLEALLDLPEPLPEPIPDPEALDPSEILELNTPVESLVELALRHRPEMISAEHTARMQVYGEKAAKADGRLKIDASGFLGKAGGAFETEDLKLKKSWNVGVQASMFFMGNSARGTGTRERTAPDLGESSRTETRGVTASVGFLDGLRGISERRQATMNKEKALMERDQTRRNIDVEVREAYYSMQKAKIQLKGAEQELTYRRKEQNIARQKERMNLIEPSQALAAESSLTEAVVSQEEAMAFYRVSLASLEKAVGMSVDAIEGLR